MQSNCVLCHVSNGVSGHTRLVFSAGDNQATSNQAVVDSFIADVTDGAALILSKMRGVDHGGGLRFASSAQEYQDMETFLGLADDEPAQNKAAFFDGIGLLSANETLRRAAMILAGRQPTTEELALANTSDAGLKQALKALMSGEGFHQFLISGANDRLLTDAFLHGPAPDILDSNAAYYRRLAERQYDMYSDGRREEFYAWSRQFQYGVIRAPLELIAYVVENDRPYTEIMTADYTMVNPQSNEIFNGGATFLTDDPTQFEPGINRGQILLDDNFSAEYFEGLGQRIDSAGDYIDYPHAGILNEPVFLNRYPTTDTNRNRARSRWTYYHFLDIDIEKSASRTTDPDALADTNNPTMNNSNCTVCHQIMDPIAGAYQNYGNEGYYRSSWGGEDSLPGSYKWSEGSLYESGDTWFRDMREPGFNGVLAPSNTNSLQWLGQQIVSNEGFARATVKFWWEAVMSEGLLAAPEDSDDPNFESLQRAYEEQVTFIGDIASEFRSGFDGGEAYNLKDLLVAMLMSEWFRAEYAKESLDQNRQLELASVGVGRLLTPRELQAKTAELTTITWGMDDSEWEVDGTWTALDDQYRIYYGGIDSRGVTERARELNTLMANVALSHALAIACPTVVFDINRTDENKRLLKFIDRYTTPITQGHERFLVSGTSSTDMSQHSMSTTLGVGESHINISFDNPHWDETLRESTLLVVHRIEVLNSTDQIIMEFEGANLADITGFVAPTGGDGNATGGPHWDARVPAITGYALWSGAFSFPVTIDTAGDYTFRVSVSRENVPAQDVYMSVALNATSTDADSAGEQAIRQQLVYLHDVMLGETLASDSEELDASYALFVDTWQQRRVAGLPTRAFDWESEACQIPVDNWWEQDWSEELADPQYIQGTWISMMIYFLTDFKYLHE